MGGGGIIIIQQREAIRTLANEPSIFGQLPPYCQEQVRNISAKGLHDWTEHEDHVMRMAPLLAKPC